MGYNEKVAARVRRALREQRGVVERKMFGGLAFLLRGNMCCGVLGNELMVRVGPEAHGDALARPHTRPMDFTGKPLRGFVYVEPAGFDTAAKLRSWVERAVKFARSLPPK